MVEGRAAKGGVASPSRRWRAISRSRSPSARFGSSPTSYRPLATVSSDGRHARVRRAVARPPPPAWESAAVQEFG